MVIGKSAEDYLEAMLMMKEKHGYIRSIDVAQKLGVTKPSVSYITMDHANFIVLTDKGMEIAQRIYARHRVLTDFFLSLGVSEETASADACRVEHDLSEETFNALCRHTEKSVSAK